MELTEWLALLTIAVIAIGVLTSLRKGFSVITIMQDYTEGSAELYTKAREIPGIPFYKKKGICKQETIWVEPVFTLTFTKTTKYPSGGSVEKLDPLFLSETKSLSLSQIRSTEVIKLRCLFARANISAEHAEEIDAYWDKHIAPIPDYVPLCIEENDIANSSDVKMVSNTASVEAITDYSQVYFYNALRPWIGSAEVTVKINSDGTLSEGSGIADSKTAQSILEFVPAMDFLGKAKQPSADDSKILAIPGIGVESTQFELSIKQEDFRHIHTAYVPYHDPCQVAAGGVIKNYLFRVETPECSPDKDENSITFTGSVSLPNLKRGEG